MTDRLISWVETANQRDCPFPLNNLPYGVFSTGNKSGCCIAIGDKILDVAGMERDGLLSFGHTLQTNRWNEFMGLGPEAWARLRTELTECLGMETKHKTKISSYLLNLSDVKLLLPLTVAEYTDFYSGLHHATNVGTIFRGPDNALPPNWLHMPIGYNGRASSVVVSGTDIYRPNGQLKPPNAETPYWGQSKRFDIELEMGAIIGVASDGPISVSQAFENIFGLVLLNDWSARDIQAWEYQPLGPFQAKATATSISPWIISPAALDPFRIQTPQNHTALLPYLHEPKPMLYDINLEVGLTPQGGEETILSRTNYNEMYYSFAQQIAHHSSSGCPMRIGDLIGSGTISGPKKENRGSLLELSWGGKEPFELRDKSTRSFIEDFDTLRLGGYAQAKDYRIGFGDCIGQVLPARPHPI